MARRGGGRDVPSGETPGAPGDALRRAALSAALEALGAAAYLLGPDGAVLQANAAGRARLQRDPGAVAGAIARALAGDGAADGELALSRVAAPGHPPHWIAVQRGPRGIEDRGQMAAARWGLTPRQARVAVELARGRSNRDIAKAIGCAESTVELHVTAVLDKSGCRGRAELVARFWTEC